MPDLSKILFPNKANGDTFNATEVNEVKTKVNALIDAFNALSAVTPPTTTPATNQAPNVAISLSSTSIVAGTNVTVTASATDLDGSISKIQILNGSTVIAEGLTPNYVYPWQNVPQGTYSLSARATDNAGAVGTSTTITLTATAPVVVVTPTPTGWNGKPVLIVEDGDSITAGYNSSDPYPTQLQRALGTTNYTVQNVGVSGIETPGTLNKVTTDVDAKYNTNTYSNHIYTLLIGVNDIWHNIGTPATVIANIEKLHRDRIAKGWKTIACTILPVNQNFQSQLDTINANIRANWQTWGCSALCDLASEAGILNPNDGAIYGDGVHPTALGDTYIARAMKRKIDSVVQSLGVPVTSYTWSIDGTTPTTPTTPTGTYDTSFAKQNVVFTDLISATASNNTVTVSSNAGLLTDNARSVQTIGASSASIRGYLEFTIGVNDGEFVVGLTDHATTGNDYTDAQFAFHRKGDSVRAFGTATGFSTSNSGSPWQVVTTGDVYRVQVEKTQATWFKNGVVFFTNTVTDSNLALRAEVIGTPGAVVTNVQIAGAVVANGTGTGTNLPAQAVNFDFKASPTSSTVSSGYVKFLTGFLDNEVRSSTQTISVSSANIRGYVEATVSGGEFVLGLSDHATNGLDYQDYQVAIHYRDDTVRAFGGTVTAGVWTPITSGDVVRIQVEQSQVTWWLNGTKFYTENISITGNLQVEAVGATDTEIKNVKVAAASFV